MRISAKNLSSLGYRSVTFAMKQLAVTYVVQFKVIEKHPRFFTPLVLSLPIYFLIYTSVSRFFVLSLS
jgi:hypothetical protein